MVVLTTEVERQLEASKRRRFMPSSNFTLLLAGSFLIGAGAIVAIISQKKSKGAQDIHETKDTTDALERLIIATNHVNLSNQGPR